MTPQTFGPLAVMGGGTMAEAIIRGGLAAGVLDPSRLIVCEPAAERCRIFESLGIRTTDSHAEAASSGSPLLLAVKPQSFAELSGQLRPCLAGRSYLALSILAGTTAAAIQSGLGPQGRIVRAMPNTAAALQASTTAIARGAGSTETDVASAELLFSAIGTTVAVDESMMDAATAVAGSGPAYVFYLAQAMIEGALAVGFDHQTADRLVRSTIAGAGSVLVAQSDRTPKDLRAGVTSKGGTTAAAVAVLDQAKIIETVSRAIVAARDRGREIAQTPS